MENISIKDLQNNIEIHTNNSGFTLWVTNGKKRYWLLDGSMVKTSGHIRINTSGHRFSAICEGKMIQLIDRQPKNMITIKGKKYSEETIHEALKEYIGE